MLGPFQFFFETYRITLKQVTKEVFSDLPQKPLTEELNDLQMVTLQGKNFTNATHGEFSTPIAWAKKKSELLRAKPGTPTHKQLKRYSETKLTAVINDRIMPLQQEAKTVSDKYDKANSDVNQAVIDANTFLKAARNGANDTADDAKAAFDTRDKACATADGSSAGKSIVSDVACPCSGTGASNLCYNGNSNTDYASGATAAEALTAWCAVKATCKAQGQQQVPTGAQITATISALERHLGADATGVDATTILGGGTSANCNGGTGVANACVDYKKRMSGHGIAGIPWVQNLLQAAQALQRGRQATAELKESAAAMKSITASAWRLHDMLAANEMINTEAKQGEQKVSDKKVDECISAGDDTAKCNSAKGKGCTFNEKGEEGEKCELKKEVIESLKEENQEGKDGKKEEKCAGKEQGDCEKATCCKCKNNACKNSSILVNNKFTLSDAAYMGLVAFLEF
uniref:Variant surface glycoprotein 773 n=1 Tax=Trypanosoma brucei TaxID=5691 RepID=M4SVA3_9TRYP|nr:variant surface glycoprotein 773 [Trypanosoma brucei]